MYNSDTPARAELPSSKQLLRSTLIAAVVAAVLLVTVVLPAEYGIDPTGVGRVLGLTEMGQTKVQLAAEAAADEGANAPPGAAAPATAAPGAPAAPAPAPVEHAANGVAPPAPAPAPAPADPAPLDEPEDGPDGAAGPATNPAQLDALDRDLRKRVQSWFKARDPEALTCRDCTGKKEVECERCDGSSRTSCPRCGGTASIQVTETVPGRSMTGVRTIRRKIDCPGCESGDVTCRCEDGKTPCECAEDHGGAVAGYRAVSGRKAFWDFISPTGRRGRKQDDFFPAVARGEVLEDFIGPGLGIVDAEILRVTIERDRAVVVARVVNAKQDGERTPGESRTTWIKEKGKFYLLTSHDVTPERLTE